MTISFIVVEHESIVESSFKGEPIVPALRFGDKGNVIELESAPVPIDIVISTFDVRPETADIVWYVRAMRNDVWIDMSPRDRELFLEMFRNSTPPHPFKFDDGAFRFVGATVN